MECLATGFGLIEGPVWNADAGLYFSDAAAGGVNLLDRAGNVSTIVPKRRGVGGMAMDGADSLVMGGRDIAVVRIADGKTSPILTLSQLPGATGFNDLTVDAMGRVYVGSLTFRVFSGDTPTPGFLHRIDLDGTVHNRRRWHPAQQWHRLLSRRATALPRRCEGPTSCVSMTSAQTARSAPGAPSRPSAVREHPMG
jgi:sugar lactone lactonase YvrE